MRDIVLLAVVLGIFAASLRKPYIGFLGWIWLGLMTPHRLAFGFIATMPVAQINMVGTLIGLLVDRDKGKFFQHGIVVLQLAFLLWAAITTVFAIDPDNSLLYLDRFSKIMLGVFLSYVLVNSVDKLKWLIWVIYISIGFYGVKGGIFTLLTGGSGKVWGPEGTFIGDNNSLACALLMVLPIGFYLMTITRNKKINIALVVSLGLIGVSVLGSNSRGAFLGLVVMLMFWMRKVPGKQKIIALLVTLFIAAVALMLMPESYWDRMNTVKTYDKDASAMGRINAWWCAFNLAQDRWLGAGFDFASKYTFSLYAPDPLDVHTAHSIFFQVIGDHGFIGFILYMLIMLWTWVLLAQIIKKTKEDEGFKWANQLARMIQLSLIGYIVAGAFLSLPYYDLYWQLVAVAVILNTMTKTSQIAMEATSLALLANSKNQTLSQKRGPFVKPLKQQTPTPNT